MKRRRVTPTTAGGAVEASLEGVLAGGYGQANAILENLPRIPGLSMEHVPSFLHVLQLVSKFFQKERKAKPFTVVDWERLTATRNVHDGNTRGDTPGDAWNIVGESTTQTNGHKSIHDSIMDRMDAVSNSSNNNNNSGSASTESCNDQQDHQRRFLQAVRTWLEELQIHAKKRRKQETTSAEQNQQQTPRKQNVPVPYSMFLYLWELQQEHKRLTVRRSALFLSGLLLSRSKDCRYHIHQETHLADWVSTIAVPLEGNPNRKQLVQLALLQKEAIALMTHLLDKGFGNKYVKLAVAAKSLKHRCTANLLETLDSDASSVATPPGMANWRKLRDFALLHGNKEIPKVAKLLDRADECLEILVPRIDGVHRPSSRSWRKESTTGGNDRDKNLVDNPDANNTNGNVDGDLSDSDEDDIDWEDGDENDPKDTTSQRNLQHLSAVEQTMAAMEKTAGSTIFSGGRLEIDFDRRVDDENLGRNNNINSNKVTASNEDQARQKLGKIVKRLSTRHLVRLSAWLDGLRNSDNLVLADASASLVSLSTEKEALRPELIHRLSALKQDVSSVLSSASRLNIKVHRTDSPNDNRTDASTRQTNASSGHDATTILPLQGMPAAPAATSRHTEVLTNRLTKQKKKQKKLRRIQINYNK